MNRRAFCLAVVLLFSSLGSVSADVAIEMVTVGDPGNLPDTTGYGSVDHVYQIGKYEVTVGQYAEMLNAVAATDTHRLYNEHMWSRTYGCRIQRHGSPGSYTYTATDDWINRPVNYVSWFDAARFVNWLSNGQPTGKQDASTTEDGAYRLDGATALACRNDIAPRADAAWFLPSEDQWYKAAYYDGTRSVYYDYPTGADIAPSDDWVRPDPGNHANFYQDDCAIGCPYWTTEVGAFENSASPYGTFDQGGNLWEWNETVVGRSSRVLRGGNWARDASSLHAAHRGIINPTDEGDLIGFRVARVPEPRGIVLLACGLAAGLVVGIARRLRA